MPAKNIRNKNNITSRNNSTSHSSRHDKNYTNRYYQYSSEAYNIAPALIPDEQFEFDEAQPKRRRKKLTRKQRMQIIKRRNLPKYVFENQLERKFSIPAIITAGLIFLGTFAYIITFAMCAVANNNLQLKSNELKTIVDTNVALSSNANESYDLEKIQAIATKKLGMVKPEEYQKEYIDVPKQNYFVKYKSQETADNQELSLGNLFGLFAGE